MRVAAPPPRVVALAWAALAGLCACAPRAAPYRFRAPILAGVAVEYDGPAVGRPRRALVDEGAARRVTARGAAQVRPSAGPAPVAAARAQDPGRAPAAGRSGEPRTSPAPASPSNAALLAHVGSRTNLGPAAFALRLLALAEVHVPPDLADAPDGRALAERARAQGLVAATARPLDLILFDGGRLVGVVSSVRDDGTVEFVYARQDVVRRGFANPLRPGRKRDELGRVLNTFVRPWSPGDRRGQKHLSGGLLSGFVRLASLSR